MLTFLPDDEPFRSRVSSGVARALVELLQERGRRAILIEAIDGSPAAEHAISEELLRVGFVGTAMGLQLRRERRDARG